MIDKFEQQNLDEIARLSKLPAEGRCEEVEKVLFARIALVNALSELSYSIYLRNTELGLHTLAASSLNRANELWKKLQVARGLPEPNEVWSDTVPA